MAAVFDPRFKLSLVDCCLGKLYMSTQHIKLKNLRERLRVLPKSYNKISKTNSPSTKPRETVRPPCQPASARMFENYTVSVSFIFNLLLINFLNLMSYIFKKKLYRISLHFAKSVAL